MSWCSLGVVWIQPVKQLAIVTHKPADQRLEAALSRGKNAGPYNFPLQSADMRDIAAVIESEMDKRGWDQTKLSLKSGVPSPTIHRIIKRKVLSPRQDSIVPIAAAFGMTESELRAKVIGEESIEISRIRQSDAQVTLDRVDQSLGLIYKAVSDAILSSNKKPSEEQIIELYLQAIDLGMKSMLNEEQLHKVLKLMWEK